MAAIRPAPERMMGEPCQGAGPTAGSGPAGSAVSERACPERGGFAWPPGVRRCAGAPVGAQPSGVVMALKPTTILKLAIAAAALLWLLQLVPVADIGEALLGADPAWVALAVALQFAARLVAAARLAVVARALCLGLSIATLFRTLLAAGFYAVLLPGAAVAGAATWLKSVQSGASKSGALVAIVATRILGLATLTASGTAAWLVLARPAPWLVLLLGSAAAALVLVTCWFLFLRPDRLAEGARAALRRAPAAMRLLGTKPAAVLDRLEGLRLPGARVAGLVALSLGHDLLTSAVLWACARAVGADLPFMAVIAIRVALELLILLPISFAGLGVREVTLVALSAGYGVVPATAVAWSLVLLFGTLLAACAGGILEATSLWRRRASPAIEPHGRAPATVPTHTERTTRARPGSGSVTACIINFNGEAHLPATLAALAAQPWCFDDVLLVDDGSTDASVALTRRLAPHARILELGTNHGPAAARNAGFAAAPSERILFIDNDVRLTGDTVRVLIDTLDRNPMALAVAPRVLYEDDPRTIQYESADCHFSGMMVPRHADRPVEEAATCPAVTGSLITACFLIDRGRWRGGPPFDESFGFNLEDHDFGVRATLQGHALWVDPRGVVLHGTGTVGLSHRPGQTVPEARLFYLVRNRWFVLVKCFSARTLLLLAPALALIELGQAVALLGAGRGRPWWRALVSLIAHRRMLRARRLEVQRSRLVRDSSFLIDGGLPLRRWITGHPAAALAVGLLEGAIRLNWVMVRRWL